MGRCIKRRNKVKRSTNKGEASASAPPPTRVWEPGVDELEEGEELHYDPSTYHTLQAFHLGWPYLSFDIIRDSLGLVRSEFPHTAYFVAGTQLRRVAHQGCVNRIRSMPQYLHICATWKDTGYVQVWDLSRHLKFLEKSNSDATRSGAQVFNQPPHDALNIEIKATPSTRVPKSPEDS